MPVDVLLGLQWGDEGKGKIVDFLAPRYDMVARFQGGPNAGHTLNFDGIKHVLHQIPSGIFHLSKKNLIGNGVVLDPTVFVQEIAGLNDRNIYPEKNLCVSNKTQLILPTHKLLDAAYEEQKGENKIGSTLKGIGPTYQDKVGRLGLRVGDLKDSDWKEKYERLKQKHLGTLRKLDFDHSLDQMEPQFFEAIKVLKKYEFVEGEYLIEDTLASGKAILAEGAQGSLLDIDFGTYPFVTSSNTVTAGACTGLGVAPGKIGEVYGIFKAYCTRVGSGPFPTELFDETGEKLRVEGKEFGATTGRPRRCGWLDLPALKYSIMINGVSQLFMMKADVLSGFDEIKVCTSYENGRGEVINNLTFEALQGKVKPVFRSFKCWKNDLNQSSNFGDLPEELLSYIRFLEDELGVPVNIISTGPDRTQTIIRDSVWARSKINQ